MRSKQTIRNSLYALGSYAGIAVLAFVVRKVFTMYLPTVFLGYDGLFGNIFSLLCLTDLGIENLIFYRLCTSFSKSSEYDIAHTMAIYKLFYKVIGITIAIIGIVLIPLLPVLIHEDVDWSYVRILYICQLCITLCTYFLAYKRMIFNVAQRSYVCVKIDTGVIVVGSILQILAIIVLKSYIAYLLINLGKNLMSNFLISKAANKDYPYINKPTTVSIKELIESNYIKDIKNNLVQKVCGVIYGGTDNILITYFLGVGEVALLANYTMLGTYITTVLDKLLYPFQAAIGDMVNKETDGDKQHLIFRMFNRVAFLMSSFVAIAYIVMFNNFVVIWLGNDFLLPGLFVFAFAVNQYINWNHKFVFYYRSVFGYYELDKKYIVAGAILNIICSVILAKPLGISGIMIGTVIGHVSFWYGRVKVVYQLCLKDGILNYVVEQTINIIVFIVEIWIVLLFTWKVPNTFSGLLLRGVVCIIVPNSINVLIFIWTKPMKLAIQYVKSLYKK